MGNHAGPAPGFPAVPAVAPRGLCGAGSGALPPASPFLGLGVAYSAQTRGFRTSAQALAPPLPLRDFQISLSLSRAFSRFESYTAENQFFINKQIVTLREEI